MPEYTVLVSSQLGYSKYSIQAKNETEALIRALKKDIERELYFRFKGIYKESNLWSTIEEIFDEYSDQAEKRNIYIE